MGASRTYTAIFKIGGQLMGSFRGAMAAAQNRMRALGATAKRVGGLLKTALVGMLAGFGTFLAANVLGKLFSGAADEAMHAEQRTRLLTNALLLNQKVAKGGIAAAQKELAIIYKHNQGLEEQGVIHKDILDSMAAQLAMRGVPTKDINKSVDVMQNLLVATKGVGATEEEGTALANAWARAIKGKLMGLQKQGLNISKEQQKVFGKLKTDQARYNYLMKNFGTAYANVNRLARSTDVGKIQVFRNTIRSLSQEIGNVLLPAQAAMAKAWTDMLTDPTIKEMLIGTVKALAKAITGVADAIRTGVVPALREWITVQKQVTAAQPAVLAPMQQEVSALSTLAVMSQQWADQMKTDHPFLSSLMKDFSNDIANTAGDLRLFQTIWFGLVGAFKTAGPVIANVWKQVTDGYNAMVDGINKADSIITTVMSNIGRAILNFVLQPIRDVTTAWQNLTSLWSGTPPPAPMPTAPPMPAGANVPTNEAAIPHYQSGGIVTRPTLATLAERGPEAVVPLTARGAAIGSTAVSFAPNITINGSVSPAERTALDTNLRSLMRDFIAEFKRAQYHERRLSYEGGYS